MRLLGMMMLGCLMVSCVPVGVFTALESYEESTTITLPQSSPDVLDIVAEVGQSLGYSVSALNREAGTIRLASKQSQVLKFVIGKLKSVRLLVTLKDDVTLQTSISITGNLGKGTQESAQQLLGDFRKALLDRLKVS